MQSQHTMEKVQLALAELRSGGLYDGLRQARVSNSCTNNSSNISESFREIKSRLNVVV